MSPQNEFFFLPPRKELPRNKFFSAPRNDFFLLPRNEFPRNEFFTRHEMSCRETSFSARNETSSHETSFLKTPRNEFPRKEFKTCGRRTLIKDSPKNFICRRKNHMRVCVTPKDYSKHKLRICNVYRKFGLGVSVLDTETFRSGIESHCE